MFSKKVRVPRDRRRARHGREGLVPQRRRANEQPWLPNGLLPLDTWTSRSVHPASARPARPVGQVTVVTSPRSSSAAGPTGSLPPSSSRPRRARRDRARGRDTIGGGTRSSEYIVPGLLHDHCSASHPMASRRRLRTELDLERTACTGGPPRSSARTRSTTARPACCTARSTETDAGLGADGQPLAPGVRADRRTLRRPVRRRIRSRSCGCRAIR